MPIGVASFKHLKLPISTKYLAIVCIYMTAISPNLISLTMLLRGCINIFANDQTVGNHGRKMSQSQILDHPMAP